MTAAPRPSHRLSARTAVLVAAIAVTGAPGAAAAADAPTVESIVHRHLEARGGRERLAAVGSLLATGRLISEVTQGSFSLLWVRPDKARLELVMGPRTTIEVVSGDSAWWAAPDATPPQSAPLPPDAAREIAERGDIDGILAHYREQGYAATLVGEEDIDGERAVTIRLARGEDEWHLLSLSLASHLVLRRTSNWGRQGLAVEVEARFSDFRTVDGVVIPFAMERRAGGKLLHRIVVERVQLNPPVEMSLFDPPASLGGDSSVH